MRTRTDGDGMAGVRGRRWSRRVLYWVAVVAVSVALVIVLLLLLQPLDASTVDAVAIGHR